MNTAVKADRLTDPGWFQLAKRYKAGIALEITYNNLWAAAVELARRQGWPVIRGVEVYRNIARLALAEYLGIPPTCICRECNGAGAKKGWGQERPCPNCAGKGRLTLKHAELARIIGASQAEYAKVWIPRYDQIVNIVKSWDGETAQ